MKIHPTRVEGFEGTLEDLATAVFKMRYDKLTEFLLYGLKELSRQYESDKEKGRTKVSRMLFLAINKLAELTDTMYKVFLLCQSFMKEEMALEKKEKIRRSR